MNPLQHCFPDLTVITIHNIRRPHIWWDELCGLSCKDAAGIGTVGIFYFHKVV